MNVSKNFPATCPQVFADFIRLVGSKEATKKVLHIGDTTMNGIVKGKKDVPPHVLEAMKEYQSKKDGSAAPAAPKAAEFVPWDGTKKSYTIPKRGKTKKARKVSAPSMIVDLIEMTGGVTQAARAMGQAPATLQVVIDGKYPFDEKRQRRVFAALHGSPPTGLNGSGDEPDQYLLNEAFVQLKAANFDRVNDVAELLNGRIIFKTNTPVGWLLVYRMKGEDAMKFKRIVARDCIKVTCP